MGRICYTGNSLVLCPNIIPIASGRASKTACKTAPLVLILYSGLRLLIIYDNVQRLSDQINCGFLLRIIV